MKDVRLTKTTGTYDMLIDSGSSQWCYDGTQVANHGLIRLRVFRGENALHSEKGTRFYEVLYNVQSSKAEIELEIKRQILSVPGALYLEEFSLAQEDRILNVSGIIQTSFGTESFETVIQL
jgi:hypothetical protein